MKKYLNRGLDIFHQMIHLVEGLSPEGLQVIDANTRTVRNVDGKFKIESVGLKKSLGFISSSYCA